MNNERKVLSSIIRSREAFERIKDHVETRDFTEQGRIIYEQIRVYYGNDEASDCVDPELLERAVLRTLSNPKHKEVFASIIASLAQQETSAINAVKDFIATKKEAVGNNLAQELASCSDYNRVSPLIESYTALAEADTLEEEDEVSQGVDLSSLVEDNYTRDKLIRVYPRALNEALDGGCLRGHHLLVFARPEMGKTMAVINMIYGFCAQGLVTLYCGNEDPIADINLRVASRLSGMSKYDIFSDPDKAEQLAKERGYDNVILYPMTPGTPVKIEAAVKKYTPDVLVIEQLRNLQMKEDNFTQQLEKAAKAVRAIGQRNNCLVISVVQAGDSATNRAVLTMGDVDSSNTGIPGAVDVMIGIGATLQDEQQNRRILSLPKNKRSGKHDIVPVTVIPSISKLVSI